MSHKNIVTVHNITYPLHENYTTVSLRYKGGVLPTDHDFQLLTENSNWIKAEPDLQSMSVLP